MHAIKTGLRKDLIKVYKYTLEGKFVKEYKSIADASRDTGISHATISSNVKGKTKKSKTFIFKKEKEKVNKYTNPKNKKIFKKDEKGDILETFESAKKAASSIDTDPRNFYLYVDRQKKYKNFYWSYSK